MDTADPYHVLLQQLKHLFSECFIAIGLFPYFVDQSIFEYEAGIEKSLVVGHQRFFDTLPHIVILLLVEVPVEDVPALHKGSILGKECILHVLKVVFGHLEVHLVLESLKLLGYFVILVEEVQLLD